MKRPSHNIPKIGISRCLLGDVVRYDGKSRYQPGLIEKLQQDFELLPICPEVEAGLSVPRPAVHLTASILHPLVIGRDDPDIDITDLMQTYCRIKSAELSDISGFVFKSRSPSCGVSSTPVYINGKIVTETSSGLFARAIMELYPQLPVTEETNMEKPDVFQDFKHRVFGYNARLD
jgi:uncharacterized protein YbbK (DUF523 family)